MEPPRLIVRPVQPPPAGLASPGAAPLVWRGTDGRAIAWGARRGDERWLRLPGLATFRFELPLTAIEVSPERAVEPAVLSDACHRSVLPLALAAAGVPVLHAGAVATPAGVAGFCAVSGTGKSTLVAALAGRGFPPWADDALAVEPGKEAAAALPLPFTLRVPHPRDPPALEHPDPRPLAVLCLLSREPRLLRPEVVPLPAARAFPALLPHAYAFDVDDPEEKSRTAAAYLDLCAKVPVVELVFPPGLDRLPELVRLAAERVLR